MQTVLLSLVAAGSVAAQNFDFLSNAARFAAVNPSDPEYELCSAANEVVAACISSVGGIDALETANPSEFTGCACCASGTAIADAYSVCSDYLSSEEPSASTEYAAYGTFYSACKLADCGAVATATATRASSRPSRTSVAEDETTVTSASEESTKTSNDDDDDSATGTITAGPVSTYASGCVSMLNVVASCTNKIDDFLDLPNREKASCYCCTTGMGSVVEFSDTLGPYASSCSRWAVTADPDTAFPVARTLAKFCSKFTDVCDGAATTTDDATATDGFRAKTTGNSESTSDSTETDDAATTTESGSATSTSDNPAATAKIAGGAVAGALGLLAMVL